MKVSLLLAVINYCPLPSRSGYTTPHLPYLVNGVIGPSGVRALPLAAAINVGGHYWSERVACASGAN